MILPNGKRCNQGLRGLSLLIGFFVLLLVACGNDDEYDYQYSQPEAFDDGLETTTFESVGMDSGPIREMMDYINGTDLHRIHDILILKDGKLVFEEYFSGYGFVWNTPGIDGEWMEYGRETDHFLASVSKSVTSVVAGAAAKIGLLGSLDKKVLDYFPEYVDILTGEKAGLTLYHLITMTSGLAFDENTYPYSDGRNDITRMFNEVDPIRFVLSKHLTSKPGQRFFYNSGTTNVLAAAIARASGKKFLDFANEHVFGPLDTEGGVWHAFPSGDTFASGALFLRPRELAKIGLVYLNAGVWKGQQIVSSDWIASSIQEHVATSGFPASYGHAYGYLWWIRNFSAQGADHKCFFAAGWGDQYMFVIPDLRMVIVFNCGNYRVNARIYPFDLVENYILPALN